MYPTVDAFVQDRRDVVGVAECPGVHQVWQGAVGVEAAGVRGAESGEQGAVRRRSADAVDLLGRESGSVGDQVVVPLT